jgi:predicted ATP-binding protein involved in virulence
MEYTYCHFREKHIKHLETGDIKHDFYTFLVIDKIDLMIHKSFSQNLYQKLYYLFHLKQIYLKLY